MKIKLLPYDLKLKHTFRISREAHDVQPSLIVRLGQDGLYGLGETTGNPYYNTTVESMMAQIETRRKEIEAYVYTSPQDFHSQLLTWFPNQAFVRCALDIAAHDFHEESKTLYAEKLKNLRTADIITRDRSILQRLFEKVRGKTQL